MSGIFVLISLISGLHIQPNLDSMTDTDTEQELDLKGELKRRYDNVKALVFDGARDAKIKKEFREFTSFVIKHMREIVEQDIDKWVQAMHSEIEDRLYTFDVAVVPQTRRPKKKVEPSLTETPKKTEEDYVPPAELTPPESTKKPKATRVPKTPKTLKTPKILKVSKPTEDLKVDTSLTEAPKSQVSPHDYYVPPEELPLPEPTKKPKATKVPKTPKTPKIPKVSKPTEELKVDTSFTEAPKSQVSPHDYYVPPEELPLPEPTKKSKVLKTPKTPKVPKTTKSATISGTSQGTEISGFPPIPPGAKVSPVVNPNVPQDIPFQQFTAAENLYSQMAEMQKETKKKSEKMGVRKWRPEMETEQPFPYGSYQNQAIQGPPNWTDIYTDEEHFGTDKSDFDAIEEGLPADELAKLNLTGLKKTGTILGQGHFGQVIEVTANQKSQTTGKATYKKLTLACKILNPLGGTPFEVRHAAKQMTEEMRTVCQLDHPNILMHYGAIEVADRQTGFPYSTILILMEKCNCNLNEIRKKPGWTSDLIKVWFRDILKALQYLHEEKRLAHLDLHTGNILVKFGPRIAINNPLDKIVNNSSFKLADFGFVLPVNAQLKHRVGRRKIRAPEADSLQANDLSVCDIYSLSFTTSMYVLTILKEPLPAEAIALLKKMVDKDPTKRCSASEALEDPWLKE